VRSATPVIAVGLFSYDIGGSERVGVDLALQYRDRGYEVICFALYGSRGPFRDMLEQCGLRCVDLDYSLRSRWMRRATFQVEVWKFLRRERIAALHLHHATALILCGIPARLAGVQHTVMTEHALFQLQERPSYRRSAARYCRFAQNITVVSPDQLEYFHSELGVARERLHYIPNGVNVRSRDPTAGRRIRQEFGISPDAFVFLFAGRLNEVKNLPVMLRAVSGWTRPTRGRLIIAGDGPERAMLEALCKSLGIEDLVTLTGARSDVPDLLAAADAFVMSSRTEGAPMALLEAMSAAVPCVATAVGGIPDLLGEGAGVLVAAGSVDGLSSAMTQLIKEPRLCAQIANVALDRVRRIYSIEKVVTRYLGLLGLPERWPPKPELYSRLSNEPT
jgi:glycosyltransferase involved in cell wall biosynthesis